jgi:thioesterase III
MILKATLSLGKIMTQKFESFRYPLLVRESHLDTFGHMNNATYLQILEEARWEFITRNNFGLMTIKKIGMGPVVVEWHMKFIKELKLRQMITIESETLSYEGKIGKLRQDIFNDKNELCFQGLMTFGLFDTKERKLVEPTPEWMKAIGLVQS